MIDIKTHTPVVLQLGLQFVVSCSGCLVFGKSTQTHFPVITGCMMTPDYNTVGDVTVIK